MKNNNTDNKKRKIAEKYSITSLLYFNFLVKYFLRKNNIKFSNIQQKFISSFMFAWKIQYILTFFSILFGILNTYLRNDILYYLSLFFEAMTIFNSVISLILIVNHKNYFLFDLLVKYKYLKYLKNKSIYWVLSTSQRKQVLKN